METESKSMLQTRSKQQALVRHTHTALTVPELLVTIFSWLSKADLTSVARVCRFWTPFALEKIWETIPNLRYLMKLYCIIMQKGGTGVQEFQDIPDDGLWDVFWAYCCRVRTLESRNRLNASNNINHINHLSSQLENHLCGPSLLPNLRSLAFSVFAGEPHLIEVLPIIPAGLRALELTIFASRAAPRFLKHLNAIPLNHLSHVKISYDKHDDPGPSIVAGFLQANCETLVHLVLSHTTVSGLKQLGSFQRVTKLKVKQEGAPTELQEFFDVIGSSFSNLHNITVELDGAITGDVSVAGIGGLAACRELRTVFLKTRRWGSLTAEDVGRFGSWWPSVERFCLYQSNHYQDQVKTPLGILQDFARVWSRTLIYLRLEFDVEAPLPSLSSVMFKFEKIKLLDVGQSDILESSVDGVAGFLRKLSSRRLVIFSYSNCARWRAVMSKVKAQFVLHEDVILP